MPVRCCIHKRHLTLFVFNVQVCPLLKQQLNDNLEAVISRVHQHRPTVIYP
jgi:hypothetical protein